MKTSAWMYLCIMCTIPRQHKLKHILTGTAYDKRLDKTRNFQTVCQTSNMENNDHGVLLLEPLNAMSVSLVVYNVCLTAKIMSGVRFVMHLCWVWEDIYCAMRDLVCVFMTGEEGRR